MGVASIGEWNTLFAVQAGAAATLTGLVFVAVSINLTRILTVPGLSGRAADALLHFVQVFFISTVGLIPGQTQWLLAVEVLLIGVLCWAVQLAGQIRYLQVRTGHPWSWFVSRTIFSQLALLPFCAAGIALLLGVPGALYWLLPGFVFSFVAGILGAWILLVEILR